MMLLLSPFHSWGHWVHRGLALGLIAAKWQRQCANLDRESPCSHILYSRDKELKERGVCWPQIFERSKGGCVLSQRLVFDITPCMVRVAQVEELGQRYSAAWTGRRPVERDYFPMGSIISCMWEAVSYIESKRVKWGKALEDLKRRVEWGGE